MESRLLFRVRMLVAGHSIRSCFRRTSHIPTSSMVLCDSTWAAAVQHAVKLHKQRSYTMRFPKR